MGVCRADSTAKRKRPSTPTPFLPAYQGSSRQPAKGVVTTDQINSFLPSPLPLQRPFSHIQHLRVLSLPSRFGSSSLIGCIFFTLFAYSHSVIQDTLEPREFLLIWGCKNFEKLCLEGFALLFSVDFSQLSTLNICWVFFKALPNSGISFFIFFVDLNIKSGLLQTFTNTTVLSLPPSDPLIFVFYIYGC